MKKNKNKKVVIILIIIILLIVIGIMVALIINKKEVINSKSGNITSSNITNKQQEVQSDFSLSFLKMENNKQNMIYSPLSIKYALKMLNDGANGNTKTQIEDVIEELSLIKHNDIDDVLSLANAIYIRDNYAKYIKKNYKKTLTEKYNAEIKYDSFNNANNINSWIEDKTLGKIKNCLENGIVQSSEVLLINALAIDMEWEQSFNKKTRGSEFYLEDGSIINATTMHLKKFGDSVSYYKDNETIALTMDLKEYDNVQLEFVAIMPEENLSDYVETFSIDKIDHIIENSELASETTNGLDISMPKFSFEYKLTLKNDLMNLGITDAFNENLADFSNITDMELYISEALHKANIDFSEKGIKAAAVTFFVTKSAGGPVEEKPIEINIDKPFLYIIRDKNTKEIWFVGTLYEPNSWEDDEANY